MGDDGDDDDAAGGNAVASLITKCCRISVSIWFGYIQLQLCESYPLFFLCGWDIYCFTSVCLRWYVTFYHSKITMKKHKIWEKTFCPFVQPPNKQIKVWLALICHELFFQPPGPCVFFCHGSANQFLEDAGRCFETKPLHVFSLWRAVLKAMVRELFEKDATQSANPTKNKFQTLR